MNVPVVNPVSLADLAADSVSERHLMVPAGRYHRLSPFYLDMERAAPRTIADLVAYVRSPEQDFPPIEIATLPEATIAGQGCVITRNGEVLRETVLEFLAQGLVPDGFTPAPGGCQLAAPITRWVQEPAILAKRPWFRNFGHWLVDGAALLALVAQARRAEGLTIILGDVGPGPLRQVMLDTIALLLPNNPLLFHPDEECWAVRELHYVSPVHVPPLFKLPAALSALRDALVPDWADIVPRQKLFVVRGTGRHARTLANSNQIVERCTSRGYACVAPELLPIGQAARLFAEAKAVVGVKGAALTNTLFCRPRSVVMALSPADFPDPFFWDLCAQRGIFYGELFGAATTDRPKGLNDLVIDPGRLEAMLDSAERVLEHDER
jgi:hypothetical protein